MPGPTITTRRATLADLDQAAAVLAAAFADYPFTRWTVAHDRHGERVAALQRLSLERFGIPGGLTWLTSTDGVVQSVAAWSDSTAPSEPLDSALFERVAQLEGDRHRAADAARRQVGSSRPSTRHLFLEVVGTVPAAQGTGLARRTLAPGLRLADRAGLPALLETSSHLNLAVYERLGFAVVDHVVLAGGGPDVWTMRREPR